ncbi:MAG: UPF0182 family protein [Prochloraceae cyanobacterium]|nr:UPF0182 family protein [Prochloraceae cyanobacterium]
MNWRTASIPIVLLLFVGIFISKTLIHLLTEAWWFEGVGFSEVFWLRVGWQIGLWLVSFIFYFLFLWGNYQLALIISSSEPVRLLKPNRTLKFLSENGLENVVKKTINYIALGLIFLIASSTATVSSSAWEIVLKYLNSSYFNDRDPIYARDIGFYLFQLPFYEGILNWLLVLVVWGLLLSVSVYGLKGKISFVNGWSRIIYGQKARAHLNWLSSAIAFLAACGFWLQRYQLLYSPQGVVFGAGYTDVKARILAYYVLSIAALVVAALFVFSALGGNLTTPAIGIGLSACAWVLLWGIYPWFVEQFIVAPNQLEKELPYIAHNIELTQKAYGLSEVAQFNYQVKDQLNRQVLLENQPTIDNIRLWDYRPLLNTYRQLQEIRLYYRFKDVDVDRYNLNGDNYRQVMLAARELDYEQLPQKARTWVNQRLKYTHGYGLVMSPVNTVTPDGLPKLYIKDIPPVSNVNLTIKSSAIYYGEKTKSYIFTGTTTDEFDYPQGSENVFTQYDGTGGVPLSSVWHRLAYALDFGSIKILISNYFTNQSRIHYYRQIEERVQKVAPFLRFDNDPYVALIDGRLQWLIDAYTVSDRYPYSEPVGRTNDAQSILRESNAQQIIEGGVNYIRNSVKVVLDAYDGSMKFFVVDEKDPVLATYRKIFPNLFESSQSIPTAVKVHFRYPRDLFKIQGQMYLTYHMSNPEVFYNREDLWRFPKQIYEGNSQLMQPYYAIMRLPREKTAEFLLILPFTPANKDNTIAWMTARSDGENYGKLLLYQFPKQELVYGPRQIEARIDQNPKISQQLTLWSQQGSRVIRGDLLVIPILNSLLYVEPVYLRAEQSELPELKRVIVAYQNQIVMEKSLDEAIAAIFGSQQQQMPEVQLGDTAVPSEVLRLGKEALLTYQKGIEALRRGDWVSYGQYQLQLENILKQLNQQTQKKQ